MSRQLSRSGMARGVDASSLRRLSEAAILGTFLISLVATAITWATRFASFATPASPVDTRLNFVVTRS